MKNLNFLYLFLLVLSISTPAVANSCYVTYGNMPRDVSIQDETLKQSFSCEGYQNSIAELFKNANFDEELETLELKAKRLKELTDKLNKQMSNERAAAATSTVDELDSALEAVKDTGEMTLRCAKALRSPQNSKLVFKCIEEVFEADNAVGEFVDKHHDAETKRIMLKASQDLLVAYEELKKEWEKQKHYPLAQKAEFERRCAILKGVCVIDTTTAIEIQHH